MTEIKTITAEALKQRDWQNGVILDVRTDMEHEAERLVCAHEHVPLDRLDPAAFMQQGKRTPETPVYILCRSGGRARQAAEQFVAAGFANVFVVDGGISACVASGHPVQGVPPGQGENGFYGMMAKLPLERQVRVVAGGLAATGAFLGLTVSHVFTFVPLAIGCGLVYAGLTDRCGLALLLTKAPWNNKGGACCRPACCDGKGTEPNKTDTPS